LKKNQYLVRHFYSSITHSSNGEKKKNQNDEATCIKRNRENRACDKKIEGKKEDIKRK